MNNFLGEWSFLKDPVVVAWVLAASGLAYIVKASPWRRNLATIGALVFLLVGMGWSLLMHWMLPFTFSSDGKTALLYSLVLSFLLIPLGAILYRKVPPLGNPPPQWLFLTILFAGCFGFATGTLQFSNTVFDSKPPHIYKEPVLSQYATVYKDNSQYENDTSYYVRVQSWDKRQPQVAAEDTVGKRVPPGTIVNVAVKPGLWGWPWVEGVSLPPKPPDRHVAHSFQEEADVGEGNQDLQIAVQFNSKEYFDKAIQVYQKALQINGQDMVAQNNLAVCYHDEGKNKEAFDVLNAALKGDPKSQNLWVTYAIISHDMGHLDDARQALQKAIKLNPASTEGKKAAKTLARWDSVNK